MIKYMKAVLIATLQAKSTDLLGEAVGILRVTNLNEHVS